MSNLISVIIPTHNAGADIDACLKSLRMQTFRQFEVCVVDAQSTDDTVDKVHAYTGRVGGSLHCQSEPDLGVYDAMNKGISRSKGEWLYFLGADDVIHDPEVFADVASFIAESDVDLIYGDTLQKSSGRRCGGESSLDCLLFECNISHQAVFYHRSIFEKIGGFNLRYPIWADWDLNIRCFRHPNIRTLWVDRLIVVYNDLSGISQKEDPVFKKELPVMLLHENIKLKKELAKITNTPGYRLCRRLFR